MIVYDEPFKHYLFDNFLEHGHAKALSDEFMEYDSSNWFVYDNPLEIKKTSNNWYHFPPATYSFLQYLNSPQFIAELEKITGVSKIYPDCGLHGAGWHIQGRSSKLNVHLDYSLHPKLNLQRKFNLIYYLTPDWQPEWGGNLEFWSHNQDTNLPKEKIKTINNIFNRALLFDTANNSWHGYNDPINCPSGVYRKSIAMYYLVEPQGEVSWRNRALYSPAKDQQDDPDILNLIQQRSL